MSGTSSTLFESYLQEYIWKRKYGNDSWNNIIQHIGEVLPCLKSTIHHYTKRNDNYLHTLFVAHVVCLSTHKYDKRL